MLDGKRIAVIGVGNMGRALLKGMLRAGLAPSDIVATSRSPDRRASIATEFSVTTTDDNRAAVDGADIVLLCIKPQGVVQVAKTMSGTLGENTLLISILAGLTTDHLSGLFGADVPIVRAMPNIPAMVDAGATAICGGTHATTDHVAVANKVFDGVGEVVTVSERQMDAVTGLSGSGPAYIYMIVEALTDGGVKMGLPRDVALRLATQTVLGSAKLVKETGIHPAVLRDQVTTPGGTAIAAIHDLETHGLRTMLISAVVTATERSQELNET